MEHLDWDSFIEELREEFEGVVRSSPPLRNTEHLERNAIDVELFGLEVIVHFCSSFELVPELEMKCTLISKVCQGALADP